MKARYLVPSWILIAASCTVEPDGTSDFSPMTSGSSPTTAAAETTDGATSSSSTTSSADTQSADASSSGVAEVTGTGTDGATTGVGCGNGVPDGDEECDDGNDDEFDECTSQCTVPVCDDGMHNGSETDVDCGGTCQGCALCQLCQDETDCDGPMVCDEAGQCVIHHEISVDWRTNCPGSGQGVTIQGLPAGTYRATAQPSAGTLWLPPHTPPSTGYFYEPVCLGVTFEQMHTPVGIRYASVAIAFDAMISETETFQFAGGNFTCWRDDTTCDDNAGEVDFFLDYVCEPDG